MPQDTLPSQEIIDVETIQNDTLILGDGGMRKILLVSGINFELKSEEEQQLILLYYQNLLNSLDFPLQLLVHSRKVNIENYLAKIKELQEKESNPLLKDLAADYLQFITAFIQQNPIMSKQFFVVVPYDPLVQLRKIKKGFWGFLGKKAPLANGVEAHQPTKEDFLQLEQRLEGVAANLAQLGLRAVPLNEEEIKELLYNLYNPS